jgi:hypothetical protein
MTDKVWNISIRIVSLTIWIMFVIWMTVLMRCKPDIETFQDSEGTGEVIADEGVPDKITERKLVLQRKRDEAELRMIDSEIEKEDKKKELEEKRKKQEEELERQKKEAEEEKERKKKEAEEKKSGVKKDSTKLADDSKNMKQLPTGQKDDSPDGLLKRVSEIEDKRDKCLEDIKDMEKYANKINFSKVMEWYNAKIKAVTPSKPPQSNVSVTSSGTPATSSTGTGSTTVTEKFFVEGDIPVAPSVTYEQVSVALARVDTKLIKEIEQLTIFIFGYIGEAYQYYKLMKSEEKKEGFETEGKTTDGSDEKKADDKKPPKDKKVTELIQVIQQLETSLETSSRNLRIINVQITELNDYYIKQRLIEESKAK